MPEPADIPAYPLTLHQADQARAHFAVIERDLQLIMGRLAPLPSRAWLTGMGLIAFGSVWALLAALLLSR
jgi:hypothetical protein